MKIVINKSNSDFSLSELGESLYEEISGTPYPYNLKIDRTDSVLIEIVEKLGDKANDIFTKLEIIEIDECLYKIIDTGYGEVVITPETVKWEIKPDYNCKEKHPEYFL